MAAPNDEAIARATHNIAEAVNVEMERGDPSRTAAGSSLTRARDEYLELA
ncbi:MAG TPA: hypothetical protein VJ840_10625 [Gemmatimonadaceae bacterium]|nr:hypothetical protein [Gemmatimonadaceae bacterium]